MGYNYSKMRRITVDPKIIEEIKRSPVMTAEQGSGWLSSWGNPNMYQIFATMPMEERLTYAAVLEGATTPEELEVMTGLTTKQVDRGIGGLEKKGLVEFERATQKVI